MASLKEQIDESELQRFAKSLRDLKAVASPYGVLDYFGLEKKILKFYEDKKPAAASPTGTAATEESLEEEAKAA